jgi:hypothetical protein
MQGSDAICMQLFTQTVGFLVSWATILVANSPQIHPGAAALVNGQLTPPNPSTCTAGSCWDKADKFGYPECTGSEGLRGLVRGAEVDSATCYKSIYINLEPNAWLAIGVLFFFAWFTSRVWERVAFAVLSRDVRWMLVASLAFSLPSWYYSCKVSFVYVNEYLHLMQRSQMFFFLTEMMMITILTLHVRKSDPVNDHVLSIGLGTSLCHLVEILLDELQNMRSEANTYQISRNALLIVGDAAILAGMAYLSATLTPNRRIRAFSAAVGILASELLLFQLLFADSASWRALS